MNEYKKQIQEALDDRELLEQLAEEAMELGHAALKCIRAFGYNDNPTPVTKEEASANLLEEFKDVLLVAEALEMIKGDYQSDNPKWERWAKKVAKNVE